MGCSCLVENSVDRITNQRVVNATLLSFYSEELIVFAGGLILSIAVLSFAGWLHWNEQLGWENENYDPEADADYLATRRQARRRVHAIFAACGFLILFATLAGPGPVFVGAWTCVAFALMVVVGLALLDAIRTQRYHSDKLSKIRRQLPDVEDC